MKENPNDTTNDYAKRLTMAVQNSRNRNSDRSQREGFILKETIYQINLNAKKIETKYKEKEEKIIPWNIKSM